VRSVSICVRERPQTFGNLANHSSPITERSQSFANKTAYWTHCWWMPDLVCGWLMSGGSLGMLPRCLWSRSRSLLLKIEIQFPLSLSLFRPIDTNFRIWVAYIKCSLGLQHRRLCSRARPLLLKIENQLPLNYFSLLRPFDTKFSIWVANIDRQLGIATHVSVIKVLILIWNTTYTFQLLTS